MQTGRSAVDGVSVLGHADEGATHQGSIIRDLGCLGKPGRVLASRVGRRSPAPRRPPLPETPHSRRDTATRYGALVASRGVSAFLHRPAAAGARLPQQTRRCDADGCCEARFLRDVDARSSADAVRPLPCRALSGPRRRDRDPASLRDRAPLSPRSSRRLCAARGVGPSQAVGPIPRARARVRSREPATPIFSHESRSGASRASAVRRTEGHPHLRLRHARPRTGSAMSSLTPAPTTGRWSLEAGC